MRKLIALIFTVIFLAGQTCFAEDDLWDNFTSQDIYNNQKAVSDEEFNEALDSAKQKRFGKKKNKNIPKGDEFHQSNETEMLKQTSNELPVICVPADLIVSDGKILPIGHYQIKGELKEDGTPVLKLYQAHYLMGEIQAVETDEDFDQENIYFANLIGNGDKQVKIIFGSLDFNAYSIINIAE